MDAFIARRGGGNRMNEDDEKTYSGLITEDAYERTDDIF